MSDRVAYPVGNTNGRDHIYFPIISPAFAASEGLPARALGVNLATMMALAWRVKKWRVSVGGVSGALHDEHIINFDDSGTDYVARIFTDVTTAFDIPAFDVVMSNGATREAGLLDTFFFTFGSGSYGGLRNAGWIGSFAGIVSETTTFHRHSVTTPSHAEMTPINESGVFDSLAGSGATIQIGDGPSTGGFNGVYYDPGPKLFYPEFSFTVSVILHYGGQFRIAGDMRDVSGTDGTFTVDPLIAPSFQLPLKASGFLNTPPFQVGTKTETGAVTATMTAIEFWPYRNSQGLPVYDTASGAQLVSPFS